jgi:hypothetical protein
MVQTVRPERKVRPVILEHRGRKVRPAPLARPGQLELPGRPERKARAVQPARPGQPDRPAETATETTSRKRLRNLKAILTDQTSDEVVLARDFVASIFERPGVETPVIVQAVLDKTAVVYPVERVEDKRVVRLDLIMVEERHIRWVPQNPRVLREMRAREIGQKRGRLTQGK